MKIKKLLALLLALAMVLTSMPLALAEEVTPVVEEAAVEEQQPAEQPVEEQPVEQPVEEQQVEQPAEQPVEEQPAAKAPVAEASSTEESASGEAANAPANNIEPKYVKVMFFKTEEASASDGNAYISSDELVGTELYRISKFPTTNPVLDEDHAFDGWYYVYNGEEYRYLCYGHRRQHADLRQVQTAEDDYFL